MDDEKIKLSSDDVTNSEASATSSDESKAEADAKTKKPKKTSSRRHKNAPASSDNFPEDAVAEERKKEEATTLDAPSLDSLIIDDGIIEEEKNEPASGFDEFLADYKRVIKNTLSAAKSALSRKDGENTNPDGDAEITGNSITEEADDESEASQFTLNIGDEAVIQADEEVEEDSANKYNPEKPRTIDNIFDFVELFVFTLAAVLILTTFFFKHTIVDGDSMLNTLHDGEHLIISDVFYTPERGDIIVFEDRSTILDKPVVKRVIGLPGETVEIKINKSGEYEVYIDGEYLEEDYDFNSLIGTPTLNGPWVVGEDEVFVLGDNRYNSTDSRHSGVGPIKIDSILGKVLLRIYPFDKFGTVN